MQGGRIKACGPVTAPVTSTMKGRLCKCKIPGNEKGMQMTNRLIDQRFSIITLGVDDVPQAREFLESHLGWQASGGSSQSIGFYQVGSMAFAVYSLDGLAEDAGIGRSEIGFSSFTLAYNTRSREEVDVVYERLVGAGAQAVKSPRNVFWGGYSSYVRILGYHLLEIAFNPFVTFDEDGAMTLPLPEAGAGGE